MKQFSVILLIFSFLWSTSGIGVLMHYCGGKLKHSSLYVTNNHPDCHKNCCHKPQEPVKACCILKAKLASYEEEGCKKAAKGCCSDGFLYIKIAEEFLALDTDLSFFFPVSVDIPNENHHNFPVPSAHISSVLYAHPPPPLLASISVLFQQFRL